MTALDCSGDLQARMPSDHVCARLELPPLPHVPNQEPPRPQQLNLPDFSMIPHLEHKELIIVVIVIAGVYMSASVKDIKSKTPWSVTVYIHTDCLALTFAGLYTLEPPVIHVSSIGTSALLKPNTARSATAGSARFFERAALRTRQCISDRQDEGWCAR